MKNLKTSAQSPEEALKIIESNVDEVKYLVFSMPYLRKLSVDDKEDITQTVLLRIRKYVHTYKPQQDIGIWISRIIRNVFHKILLDNKKDVHKKAGLLSVKGVTIAIPENPETIALNKDLVEFVYQEIDKLAEPEKSIVEMYYLQGFSIKDVSAKIQSISYRTVRRIVQRFKNNMRILAEK